MGTKKELIHFLKSLDKTLKSAKIEHSYFEGVDDYKRIIITLSKEKWDYFENILELIKQEGR